MISPDAAYVPASQRCAALAAPGYLVLRWQKLPALSLVIPAGIPVAEHYLPPVSGGRLFMAAGMVQTGSTPGATPVRGGIVERPALAGSHAASGELASAAV